MGSLLNKLILYFRRKNFLPQWLTSFVMKHKDIMEIRTAKYVSKDPYADDHAESSYASEYPYVLGILKEFWHFHWHYIAACRELGVAYKLLDISGPDWQDVVENSGCDAFLVHPSVQLSIWKQMYDERLRIMVKDMGKIIFPSYDELWIWESKRRMHYWLKANKIPHPKTWVFYDQKEAFDFVEKAKLPIVYKSNMGAGASGVIIFRDKYSLKKHLIKCFKHGVTTWQRGPNDKEWGSIFLQEYISNVREWRIVRIGDSYFGFEKLPIGDFHSGSLRRKFNLPPSNLLYFIKNITDKGRFYSMAVDVFLTKNGQYLVNELQTIFGIENSHEMCVVDGKPGRMLYDTGTASWKFEAGNFCQNYLCNLRVTCLLESLGEVKDC